MGTIVVGNAYTGRGPNDSDTLIALFNTEVKPFYNKLAESRGIPFASKLLEDSTPLGYTIARRTLEAAVALDAQHPHNGKLERLPQVVERIYALTQDQTREQRLKFLEQVRAAPTLEVSQLETHAEKFYVPSHAEICDYVIGLTVEGRTLISKSQLSGWDTMAAMFPKHYAQINHFSRLERQFNFRLSDYLPPPSTP